MPKKINFVCRIVDFGDDKPLYKFDILYRSDLVITNGCSYNSLKDAAYALADSILNLGELDLDSNKHLIYKSVE